MKKHIFVLFFSLIFFSCQKTIKNEITVSSEEILYDALNPSFFKTKYKNRIITITGNVIVIYTRMLQITQLRIQIQMEGQLLYI